MGEDFKTLLIAKVLLAIVLGAVVADGVAQALLKFCSTGRLGGSRLWRWSCSRGIHPTEAASAA
jgi:hypothetical protein